MSAVTINLPDDLMQRATSIAEQRGERLEDVLLEHLQQALIDPAKALPVDTQRELAALHHLSDSTLWRIVGEQLPQAEDDRLQTLMDANSRGDITEEDSNLLESLVHKGEQLTLRKAEAAAILTERGFTVTQRHMQGFDGA